MTDSLFNHATLRVNFGAAQPLRQFVWAQWRLPWAPDSQHKHVPLVNAENDAVDPPASSPEKQLSHVDLRASVAFQGLLVGTGVIAKTGNGVVVGIEPRGGALARPVEQPLKYRLLVVSRPG
jgi:hypothetical protein